MQWLLIVFAILWVVGCEDHSKEDPKHAQALLPIKQASEKKLGADGKPEIAAVSVNKSISSSSKPLPVIANEEEGGIGEMDDEEIALFRQEYDNAKNLDDKIDALVGLIQVDEANALSILQEAYQSPEAKIRKEVVMQLQDFIDEPQAVDLLLHALDDSNSNVVMDAIEGLSAVDEPDVSIALAELARSHPDEAVRETAKEYVDQSEPDSSQKSNNRPD